MSVTGHWKADSRRRGHTGSNTVSDGGGDLRSSVVYELSALAVATENNFRVWALGNSLERLKY